MEWEILKEDSIVKLISSLSQQLTIKPSLTKSENDTRSKDFFKTSYEILLNKRRSDISDHRSNYVLDELLMDLQYYILSRNKAYITKEIKNKIVSMVDRLGEMARKDADSLLLVKSVLRIFLLMNDYLPQRRIKGVLKYKDPVWFPPLPEWKDFKEYFNSNDVNFRSMMCMKNNYEAPLFPVLKLKKSATWHEGVVNALTIGTSPSTSITRPSSQTFVSQDEGFVTPDDYHREVTPEPLRDSKRELGWWYTWDVVSSPPSLFKTWESQWISPTAKEPTAIYDDIESSYKAARADSILKGVYVPPSLDHFITPNQLANDIVSLICGLPSSTFKMSQDGFKLVEGTFTTGVMPNCLVKLVSPYIKFAEIYHDIESYIHKIKSFDQIISQALCESLHRYLYQLKSLLIADIENIPLQKLMFRLDRLILKPLANMEFIWNIINSEGVTTCHQVLEKFYSSMPCIHDEELLCIINIIVLKCCYIYIDFFEKFINTGICAEELLCEGTGSLSVEKVPYFLRSLADVINNSNKTLKLLHRDPKMALLKPQISSEKPESPKKNPIDPIESVKQHYLKFMKEKEEEKTALAMKKAKQLKEIKEDIVNKQHWKELEEMKIELAERKRQDRYEELDAIKQQYIDNCKKEVEAKYDILIRKSERKIAVANWKLKRLASETARSEVIKNDAFENQAIRKEFMSRGIDISEENRELITCPVEVNSVKINKCRTENIEAIDEVVSRHEEASEIRKRMMEGSATWKYNDNNGDNYKKVSDNVDAFDGIKMYEENRSKALAIKKKVMTSEFEMDPIPCVSPKKYNGLSASERQHLEQDLTMFPLSEPNDKNSFINSSLNFLHQKKQIKKIIELENENKFHSGILNSVEMQHIFLKSAGEYLKKEVEVTNKVMLQHIKEDYVNEVRWIMDYYLLLNDIWASNMIKKLITFIRQGTINLIALNHLFPHPLALRESRPPPPILDPADPRTVDFLVLTYKPREPLHHFIGERFLLKYNANFLYLIKIELACRLLLDALQFLRSYQCYQGVQYNQIHFHIHIMNHFNLCLKSFRGNSFEKCWEKFIADAEQVKSLDELYSKSFKLLRNSQYFCLQNKRTSKIHEILMMLLQHVYKYCDTLQCGILSISEDGELVHSLHPALINHFHNFLSQARTLYSLIVRLTESGVAEAFSGLYELLSVNNFYSSL